MRFHRGALSFLAVSSLFAAPVALAAAAETSPGAIVILDGSGSMWGALGAETTQKIDAARDSLKQTLGRAAPDARLGLMSFGHRRKADCQDVELMVPLAPGNRADVENGLAALNPKGKGPITLALREAAKAAAGQSVSSLILIHDGSDNCQQDPCAAAAEIAKARPGLAVHTIGLGLERDVVERYACLARATGGRAFDVRDSAALGKAVDEAFALAGLLSGAGRGALAGAPKPQPVAPEVAATTGPPRVRLTAHLGSVAEPIAAPVKWTVRASDDPKPVIQTTAAELSQPIPPGAYEVEARLGLATLERKITVAEKGVTSERVEFDAGVLDVSVKTGATDAAGPDFLLSVTPADKGGVTAPGGRRWIGRHARTELVLPAGRYAVRATEGLSRHEELVSIEAGDVATVNIALPSGRLELSAAEREGGELLDGASYTLAVDDPDSPEGRREVARSLARDPSFTLPAGTYYVTARIGSAEARERVAVGAGSVARKTIIIPVARLAVSANLKLSPAPELPISYRIHRLDGEASVEAARGASPRAEFLLAPGKYRIDANAGAQNAAARQVVDLAAGSRKDIVIGVEVGQLHLALGGGAAAPPDSFWEVRDASDVSIWRTTRPEPEGFLAPGRYSVRFESRDRRLETTVELAAGESRRVELSAE